MVLLLDDPRITADQHHQPTVSPAKAVPPRGFPMCRESRGGAALQAA
jgi:hypothetical protein